MIIMKMMTISTMMMTIAITITTMTKIINLCRIKCDSSLESQDKKNLESDDDNNDDSNDKNQLKVIRSILKALFIKFNIKVF